MRLRSLLFVPGDRPERFAKAAASGADAVILDLEDSVGLSAKATARAAVADYLTRRAVCRCWCGSIRWRRPWLRTIWQRCCPPAPMASCCPRRKARPALRL
jgi:hypothetical protein